MGDWIPRIPHDYIGRIDHGIRTSTSFIVWHAIEGGSRSCLNYFKSGQQGDNGGDGTQFIVGRTWEETWEVLPHNRVAWASGYEGNHHGVHLEQAGFTSWNRNQWMTHRYELEITAAITSWLLHEYNLGRPKWLGNIYPHSGCPGHTDHGDPGDGYPHDYVVDRTLAYYNLHWNRRVTLGWLLRRSLNGTIDMHPPLKVTRDKAVQVVDRGGPTGDDAPVKR